MWYIYIYEFIFDYDYIPDDLFYEIGEIYNDSIIF